MSDVFMRNVVHHGYSLEFVEGTTLPLSRIPFAFNLLRVGADLLHKAVQRLLDKNANEPVLDDCSPGFYSRLFLDGGQRPVINLSRPNSYLEVEMAAM